MAAGSGNRLCDLAAAVSELRPSAMLPSAMPRSTRRRLLGFRLRQAGDNQVN
jgi:hypothetical protein